MDLWSGANAAQPYAWTASAQRAAGNLEPDKMLPIVIGPSVLPTLPVAAVSPLVGAPGAPVPTGCLRGLGGRRRLHSKGVATLDKPAVWAVSWNINGSGEGQLPPVFSGPAAYTQPILLGSLFSDYNDVRLCVWVVCVYAFVCLCCCCCAAARWLSLQLP